MSLIKDFRCRHEIDSKAAQLVNDSFSVLAMKKIQQLDDKKAQKKIAVKVQGLKRSAHGYIQDNKLGVYGKARLLRELQNRMKQNDFNSDLIDAISRDFLADPLRK